MQNELLKRAVSSAGLDSRSSANQRFAQNDFTSWTRNLIGGLGFTSVLDVCCGTGNQLVLYAERPRVKKIVGVDASRESLDKAKERLADKVESGPVILKALKMEDMFNDADIAKERFDLISCFYGL